MPWTKEETITTDEIIVDLYHCPICGSDDCVPPSYEQSDVLWIGESPGEEEVKRGKPFVGPTGRLVQAELSYLGLPMYTFRMCNLWIHPPPNNKKSEYYNDCFEYSVKIVMNEAKDKKLVVLVGAETVKFFTGLKVSDWNGLLVKSNLLSNPYILALVHPATAFKGSCGEMRFGLQRFAHYMEEING